MADLYGFDPDQRGALRYLRAIRTRWKLIVLIVVVAVGTAVAYSLLAEKTYEAEADVIVTPVAADDQLFIGFSLLREGGNESLPVLTAGRYLETPAVAMAAAEELGNRSAWKTLQNSVEINPISQSDIVAITGKASTPDEAAAIANAVATAAIAQLSQQFQTELTAAINRLETRLDSTPVNSTESITIQERLATLTSLRGTSDPTMRVLSEAIPPDSPSSPRPFLTVGIALIVSLLWGIGVAIALEFLGQRISSEEELQLSQRLPILARVPRLPKKVVRGYLTHHAPLPASVWESYRTLRAGLAVAGKNGTYPETILVTSAIPGEGKTMTSVSLAVTMALSGMQVILVDGDLRRPMVASVFGTPAPRHGFASLLLGAITPDQALVDAPGYDGRLKLLLASRDNVHLVDLLTSGRVESALRELAEGADVVIIDSPPLTAVADALPLADAADAVLVAVRLGHTRRDALAELREMFAQHRISVTGLVVTTRETPRHDSHYYQPVEPTDVTARSNGPGTVTRVPSARAGTRAETNDRHG